MNTPSLQYLIKNITNYPSIYSENITMHNYSFNVYSGINDEIDSNPSWTLCEKYKNLSINWNDLVQPYAKIKGIAEIQNGTVIDINEQDQNPVETLY